MKRRFENVAVLMGGISSEREVSLNSGAAVAQGLRDGGYRVAEVDITAKDFILPPDTEAVFIALHGEFGEDGQIQRILEERGIPYTGSGPESSRTAFDKILTRQCLEKNGIPVPPGEVLRDAAARTLPVPLAVKPPRQGSSVGVHLVLSEEQWPAAFSAAAQYDAEVLAEEYIPGRELTVGIVGNEVLPVVEICPTDGWYDFVAKYVRGDTTYVVPAELDKETAIAAQEMAWRTFQALEADGFGRVDFRLSPEGKLYVLELNNIPGFTATSLLPKAAQSAGTGFSELCCRIMELAHI
ncbi:MAG: D-alanine--D-alanine ligase [Kiritimatiellales bacterium]|nr:D-alanine--D-alanine ligase [Kiritimatiellales bacterium]